MSAPDHDEDAEYSTSLYRKLGDLVDYPMNYHVPALSGLRIAPAYGEFRHVERMGRQMGANSRKCSPMQEIHPFLETHDLYGGQWTPLTVTSTRRS